LCPLTAPAGGALRDRGFDLTRRPVHLREKAQPPAPAGGTFAAAQPVDELLSDVPSSCLKVPVARYTLYEPVVELAVVLSSITMLH
jgi:hypothetical protein